MRCSIIKKMIRKRVLLKNTKEVSIMPILRNVEAKIRQVEGFTVHFFRNGVNVNGNKEDIPQYPYSMKAPNDWTVARWISKRFSQTYPGYDAKVIDANGMPVAVKNVKLSTIRKK